MECPRTESFPPSHLYLYMFLHYLIYDFQNHLFSSSNSILIYRLNSPLGFSILDTSHFIQMKIRLVFLPQLVISHFPSCYMMLPVYKYLKLALVPKVICQPLCNISKGNDAYLQKFLQKPAIPCQISVSSMLPLSYKPLLHLSYITENTSPYAFAFTFLFYYHYSSQNDHLNHIKSYHFFSQLSSGLP